MGTFPMIRALGLAILCAIVSGFEARADDCSSIDLRQGTFKNVPVQDQDGMGFCYGYAAAGMIDAWRFTHGDQRRNHLTSGVEATITHGAESGGAGEKSAEFRKKQLEYVKKYTPPEISGRQIFEKFAEISFRSEFKESSLTYALDAVEHDACEVASSILKNGSCNANAIAASKGTIDYNEDKMSQAAWIHVLGAQYDAYKADRDRRGTVSKVEGEAMRDVYARKSCHWNENFGVIYDSAADSVKAVKSALRHENPIYFLKKMIDPSCRGSSRIEVPPFECQSKTIALKQDLEEFDRDLDQQLKKGLPVQIDFCSGVLKNGPDYENAELYTYGTIERGCTPNAAGGSDAHAALVIGRRPDPKTPGKCQLLVRNSWGSTCDTYQWCATSDGKVSSLSASNGLSTGAAGGRARCSRGTLKKWDCDKGNIWVDAEALRNNLTDYRLMNEPAARK